MIFEISYAIVVYSQSQNISIVFYLYWMYDLSHELPIGND